MSARRGAISFVDFTDGIVGRILATHPSVDKRISRIEDLKKESTKTTTEADRRTARSESVGSTDSTAEESSLDQYTNEQMIDALQTVDAYSFEELVADLWDAMGWETTVTTESKDRGVDVIAERGSPFHEKQIIQAKRYSDDNPVSSSEIQQYAGLYRQEENVDAVVVVTTGRFTSDAQEVATETNVKLVDGDDLCELIRGNDDEISPGTIL